MKKMRVVLVYEIFQRENINVVLLKKELEYRGFDVVIRHKTEELSFLKTDILVIPNCYTTGNYDYYRYRFNCKSNRIINLQVEQVYVKKDEDNLVGFGDGKSKEILTLCWGKNRLEKQIKNGISQDKLRIVGAIHTDSARKEFYPLWEDRTTISKEYGIPNEKKWILFISSFSYTNSKSPFLQNIKEQEGDGFVEFRSDLETKSQNTIINWLEEAIKRTDNIIIYRPHPSEISYANNVLNELTKKYPNRLFVVPERNLKQWIAVCDLITMWDSTSIIECYYSGKDTAILRPYDIPAGWDYALFEGSKQIKSMESFISIIESGISGFPVNVNKLSDYYDISDSFSFIRICDVICEENETMYRGERFFSLKRFLYNVKNHFLLKMIVKRFYQTVIYGLFGISFKSRKLGNRLFIDEWENYYKNRRELKKLESRVDCVLKNIRAGS